MQIIRNRLLKLILPGMLLFCGSLAAQQHTGVIRGRIVDAKTNLPLQTVNVFLANTMLGAATDSDGHYAIRNVPPGQYEITVSYIGYATRYRPIRIEAGETLIENFYLESRVLQGETVTVTAIDPEKRQRYLARFKRIFLGASHEELNCRLINPDAVGFSFEEKTQVLEAFANEPLIVENRATGYRVTFVLGNFNCQTSPQGTRFTYTGRARFQELQPRNNSETDVWRRNRLIAYYGSLRHFLTALANDQLGGSGFQFFRATDPGERTLLSQPKQRLAIEQILADGEDFSQKILQFEGLLEVIYHYEGSPQTSYLSLREGRAIIDRSGQVVEPFDPFVLKGNWASENLTEFLPREYLPDEDERTRPVLTAEIPDYFEQGAQQLELGEPAKALDIWRTGAEMLEVFEKPDPRLAFSFIALVTENQERHLYESACRQYYLALTLDNYDGYYEAIAAEVERVAPLLDEAVAAEWREDLKKKRPELLQKIKSFWLRQDPTPTSVYNERLIEHWERIAYARQHFTKANTTPYGTDDRGLIFVRYGPPSRSRFLNLGTMPGELERWGRGSLPSGMLGASAQIGSLQGAAPLVDLTSPDGVNQLRSNLNRFNFMPECELWAYENIVSAEVNYQSENLVFLFGPRSGRGQFGLREGIEDFIPSEAFMKSNAKYGGGMLPGALLQLIYYRDVSAFDHAFANRYDELESLWNRARSAQQLSPNFEVVRSLRTTYQAIDKFDSQARYADKFQSDLEDRYTPLQMQTYLARILDNANRPKLIFVSFALPENVSAIRRNVDSALVETSLQESLQYSLIIRNHRLHELRTFAASPLAPDDLTGVFTIEHKPEYHHFTVAIQHRELIDSQLDSVDASLRLPAGRTFIEAPPVLDTDTNSLEASDIVLGVLPPEDFNLRILPFPVVPARVFRPGDPMQVYFEAYHLSPDKEGKGRFRAEFRVVRLEQQKNKLQRKEMIASAFDFESHSATAKEQFGVSLDNLRKGTYELEVEIRDRNSGKKCLRSAQFEIVE